MKKIRKREMHNEISVPKQRFVPLDVIRGLTMVFMIIANNPGAWSNMWPFLEHSPWIGLTFADTIFPAFITCMGFAMVFSLKRIEKIDWLFVRKVILRGLILILIGWFFTAFGGLLEGLQEGKNFVQTMTEVCQNFRFYGVFFRLGVVSLFSSAIIVLTKKNIKIILAIAGGLIFAYFFILGFGHGYENSKQNILYIVDRAICGDAHLYHHAFDPEGFLSNIPCIGQVLLAYGIGKIFMEKREKFKSNSNLWLFTISALLIIGGLFCSTFSPISKKVWSPSFVFITTGITLMMISLITFFTLRKEHKKELYLFNAVGSNALGVYIISSLLALFFNYLPVNGTTLHGVIYGGFKVMCCQNLETASFVYSLFLLIICWIIAVILYRKKIFIRL